MCSWIAGFEGDECEMPVKGCSGVTCKNGGTCISSGGHNYCECPVDKEGHDCDRGESMCISYASPSRHLVKIRSLHAIEIC